MNLEHQLRKIAVQCLAEMKISVQFEDIIINAVPKGQEGDICIVVFPFAKAAKMNPADLAQSLAEKVMQASNLFSQFTVNKGFINLSYSDATLLQVRSEFIEHSITYILPVEHPETIVLEYIGPNTNKPLHLGHVRNMVLGYSVSQILEAVGHNVKRVNIYNDRGIAICKSMVAWRRSGNGETPDSSGIKGDHFVGAYYIKFGNLQTEEAQVLIDGGMPEEEAMEATSIMKEARETLLKWENNDPETIALWKQMNEWVYAGFQETYSNMGVDFEQAYYESETYLDGKEMVLEALKEGKCYQKEDGSIWVDLEEEGLDQKILLRADGTSVYVTQDLGTAKLRYADYKMDKSLYTVADEQNYHFQVLKKTLQKFGEPYAEGIHHLAYGLVTLPTGRLKSREGTKVDADDLMVEMQATAKQNMQESGRLDEYSKEEVEHISALVGMGALKFFLLRVSPKKKLMFDPSESVDFLGDTGPLVQYTHARIRSILRKAESDGFDYVHCPYSGELNEEERNLILKLTSYSNALYNAAAEYDPSIIAQYCVQLARLLNKFYSTSPILKLEDEERKGFRMHLCSVVANTLKHGMQLLGTDVPEKM